MSEVLKLLIRSGRISIDDVKGIYLSPDSSIMRNTTRAIHSLLGTQLLNEPPSDYWDNKHEIDYPIWYKWYKLSLSIMSSISLGPRVYLDESYNNPLIGCLLRLFKEIEDIKQILGHSGSSILNRVIAMYLTSEDISIDNLLKCANEPSFVGNTFIDKDCDSESITVLSD